MKGGGNVQRQEAAAVHLSGERHGAVCKAPGGVELEIDVISQRVVVDRRKVGVVGKAGNAVGNEIDDLARRQSRVGKQLRVHFVGGGIKAEVGDPLAEVAAAEGGIGVAVTGNVAEVHRARARRIGELEIGGRQARGVNEVGLGRDVDLLALFLETGRRAVLGARYVNVMVAAHGDRLHARHDGGVHVLMKLVAAEHHASAVFLNAVGVFHREKGALVAIQPIALVGAGARIFHQVGEHRGQVDDVVALVKVDELGGIDAIAAEVDLGLPLKEGGAGDVVYARVKLSALAVGGRRDGGGIGGTAHGGEHLPLLDRHVGEAAALHRCLGKGTEPHRLVGGTHQNKGNSAGILPDRANVALGLFCRIRKGGNDREAVVTGNVAAVEMQGGNVVDHALEGDARHHLGYRHIGVHLADRMEIEVTVAKRSGVHGIVADMLTLAPIGRAEAELVPLDRENDAAPADVSRSANAGRLGQTQKDVTAVDRAQGEKDATFLVTPRKDVPLLTQINAAWRLRRAKHTAGKTLVGTVGQKERKDAVLLSALLNGDRILTAMRRDLTERYHSMPPVT